ncbi:membrane protein insertion efficiency factor YidD [Isoptericola jiangsuensis]|uniref:membrane protein insertion efficiency factor YidD n=1 Tax=Isoptericola jiangsuensis TaxID=548579 RepID=UPI003AAF8CD0
MNGCGDGGNGRGGGSACRTGAACLEVPGCDWPDRRRAKKHRPSRRGGGHDVDGSPTSAPANGVAGPEGSGPQGSGPDAARPESASFAATVAARPAARPLHRWALPRHLGIAAIRTYQRLVSARRPARCRYVPTCSGYGLDAVREYGLVAGSRMAVSRVRRCTREVPLGTIDPLVGPAA